MQITIHLDSDETEIAAILKAIKAIQKGQKPAPEPQKEGGIAQVEIAYSQPAPKIAPQIGFVPMDPFE